MPGYISKVTMIPDQKISIIILNNGNDGFVDNAIRGDIMDILVKGREFDWIGEYSSSKARSESYEQTTEKQRLASRVTGTKTISQP